MQPPFAEALSSVLLLIGLSFSPFRGCFGQVLFPPVFDCGFQNGAEVLRSVLSVSQPLRSVGTPPPFSVGPMKLNNSTRNNMALKWKPGKKGTLYHIRTPHSFFWFSIWRWNANQKKRNLTGNAVEFAIRKKETRYHRRIQSSFSWVSLRSPLSLKY